MKKIYSYHPETLEFISESFARRSPLDKDEIYLIPKYATDKEPTFEDGKIAKFVDEEWILEDVAIEEKIVLTEAEPVAILQTQLITVRISYLQSTDWYIAREADEPDSYPQEIKNKRILARAEIKLIESCTTLTELSTFNINF